MPPAARQIATVNIPAVAAAVFGSFIVNKSRAFLI
jgi:hypothetical protein